MDRISSGITYAIDGKGIEYPQKMTTVKNSFYPLLDSHLIDWDTSYLKYISQFDKTLINAFSYNIPPSDHYEIAEIRNLGSNASVEKLRYKNDNGIDQDTLSKMPLWNTDSQIDNTSELLDVIDFLSWQCAYSFSLIKNLYDIENTISPVLSFEPNQITYLGGSINDNGNVDESGFITLNIVSNQCNENFRDLVENDGFTFFESERTLKLNILATNKFNEMITDEFYYNNSGKPNLIYTTTYFGNDKTSPFSINTSIDTITTTGIDLTQKSFIMELTTRGWEPEEDNTQLSGYNDVKKVKIIMYSDLVTDVSSSKSYLRSNDLSLTIAAKKATNIFTHIYINGVRYIYLERGFFNNSSICDPSENSDYGQYKDRAFIISEDYLTEEQLENLTYLTFEENESLYERLISVESSTYEDKNLFYLVNNKAINFEIYPKYYGESEANKYNGENDIAEKSREVTMHNFCEYTYKNSSTNIEITNPKDCYRDINGLNRKGFTFDITINDKNYDANTGIYENTSTIAIGTTPTLFISGMKLILHIKTKYIANIKFIDMQDKGSVIETNYNYKPIDNLSTENNLSLANSEIAASDTNELPDHYTWDLELPIFNARSWANSNTTIDETFKMTTIYPSSLVEGSNYNKLKEPTNEYDVSSLYSGKEYMYSKKGYPGILIGYKWSATDYSAQINKALNENIWPYLLCGIYSYSKDTNKYTNQSFNVNIDYINTYRLNEDFLLHCPDFVDQQLNSLENEEEKGRKFVERYCCIKEESKNPYNVNMTLKYLVFYRPTVPDEYINDDYESTWIKDNNLFKLVLYIGDKSSGAIETDSLYERQSCIMNVKVTRAQNKYAGWAEKQKQNVYGVELKTIIYGNKYKINDLINNLAFTNSCNHTLQTRLTTEFIPDQTSTIISTKDSISNDIINIYYNYFKENNENKISFESNPEIVDYYYKIDDSISQATLYGNINSDNYFRGVYDTTAKFRFKIIRQENQITQKTISNINDVNMPVILSNDGIVNGIRYDLKMDIEKTSASNGFELDLCDLFGTKDNNIYEASDNNILQLSVTGAFFKDGQSMVDSTFQEYVFDIYPNFEQRLSEFISGSIKSNGTSPNITRPTDNYFNKWYNVYEASTDNLENYIEIENSKIKFNKTAFTSHVNSFDYVKLRIIAVFPMTPKYRGYVNDIRLKIVFN